MTHEHISTQFDNDLDKIRSDVLRMGGLVEQQVQQAIHGFYNQDVDLLQRVIEEEKRVNQMEIDLDQTCSQMIVKRQPAAKDFRLVNAAMKTVTDLERIGDEATKIARIGQSLFGEKKLDTGSSAGVDSSAVTAVVPFPRMGDIRTAGFDALSMLKQSLDAFARLDTAAAAKIVKDDKTLDSEFRAILRQLITYMMEDPRTISQALEMVFVAKAVERMGDHAKNIAEHVIFVVKGTDVRHMELAQLELTAKKE